MTPPSDPMKMTFTGTSGKSTKRFRPVVEEVGGEWTAQVWWATEKVVWQHPSTFESDREAYDHALSKVRELEGAE